MKGSQKITLKGKEIAISFTVGAMEDFQEYLKAEGIEAGLDEALSDMKHFRKLIEIMSEYGGDKTDAKEFKFLDFSEIGKVTDLINSATENISVGKAPKAKGK